MDIYHGLNMVEMWPFMLKKMEKKKAVAFVTCEILNSWWYVNTILIFSDVSESARYSVSVERLF